MHVRLCRAAPILKTEKKHYLFFVLQKEGLSTCAALLKMGGRGGGGGGAAPTTELINKLIKKLCRNLCLHAFSIRAAARKMGRGGSGGAGRGRETGWSHRRRTAAARRAGRASISCQTVSLTAVGARATSGSGLRLRNYQENNFKGSNKACHRNPAVNYNRCHTQLLLLYLARTPN